MKKMLMRPSAALFPAVLLISGHLENGSFTVRLFFCWLMLQLCSLCSAEAFRNAAAREPGVRRVDRRFSGMWLQTLLGTGLLAGLMRWIFGVNPLDMANIALPVAAACITIEQMFEERMFALSRRTDGVVLGVIANVLLLAGLCLDTSGGVASPVEMPGFFTACGAGLGALISVIAAYAMEPMRAFSLVPRSLGFFPKAAAQSLLYPAAMIALAAWRKMDLDFTALMAGMMLWRISRTVCRRAGDESRPLNLLLMAVCGALTAAGMWFAPLAACARGAAAAMICALAVYCAPGWRIYAGAALIVAAQAQLMFGFLPAEWSLYAVSACCAAAVILNLRRAFLRKV